MSPPTLPVQTPCPSSSSTPSTSSSSSRKRKRSQLLDVHASSSKVTRRQLALPSQVDDAKQRCQYSSGNDVVSCFPTADTVIPQDQWASFVWNSRLPDFTQTNLVDIYLFRADSQQQILHFPNVRNPYGQAGVQTALVNDSWWGDDGDKWNGSNVSYPFYWMVVRSDLGIRASDRAQARFNAVQTTYAASVLATMTSTASSILSSPTPITSLYMPPGGGNPNSTLAPGNPSNPDFPHWAIALIVVLGFLALASLCILTFFLLRRHRRHAYASQRNSMSSGSPMMANIQKDNISPQSPLATSSGHAHGHHDLITPLPAPGSLAHDGASTISRAGSAEQGPFSGADAAIMADAFRQALRKPDFAGRPVEEGESPDDPESQKRKEDVLKELAEEGRDIRSVSSSRGVRVETLSDSGDHTVHDYR